MFVCMNRSKYLWFTLHCMHDFVYFLFFLYPCKPLNQQNWSFVWILTGLPCFVRVGGGELIADRGLLWSHHGHQLFTRTQHQSLFCPFRRHKWWAGEPDAAPRLLEATVPFSLRFHQPLIRGRRECVRGQSVRGVWGSGPLGLEGLVDELSARDASRTLTLPLPLHGKPYICRTLIPLNTTHIKYYININII